jgi:hypothetical protein
MVKSYRIITDEIENVERTVLDIKSQISHFKLGKSTIGLLHCHPDFLHNGTVRELCKDIPFDIVGHSSVLIGSGLFVSQSGLMLTVLTSDDVHFKTTLAKDTSFRTLPQTIEFMKSEITDGDSELKMLMPIIPFGTEISGDDFVLELGKHFGEVPAFGMLPISDEADFSDCFVIYNGEHFVNAFVLTAFYGENFEPQFYSASVKEENFLNHNASVTSSERNVVKTINYIKSVDYLESVGIIKDKNCDGLSAMPFVIDLEDGTRYMRNYMDTVEDGAILFGGFVPQNAKIGFALIRMSDVCADSEEVAKIISRDNEDKTVLIYSCVTRLWSLGVLYDAEIKKVNKGLQNKNDYSFAYCGGEIFPQKLPNGHIVNNLQNNTIIMCVI